MDMIKAFLSKPSGLASIAGVLLTTFIGSYSDYGYLNPIGWITSDPNQILVAILGGGIFYCCVEAAQKLRGK